MNYEPVMTIVGNIGKEPEMRYTPEGKAITTFSVALYTGRNKEKKNNPPLWARVSCFGDLAEQANNFTKGQRVRVSGTPKPPTYIDRDGNEKPQGLALIANKIEAVVREEEVY